MSTYPKQLQSFTADSLATSAGKDNFRNGRADEVVMSAATISGDKTVNDILGIMSLHFSGITLDYSRREPRFQPFDTSFGDTVVFTDGQVIAEQAAQELIDVLRTLWDIDRAVTNNSIGYATSTQV